MMNTALKCALPYCLWEAVSDGSGGSLAFPPGGCAIGKRPIDFHVSAMRQLGADISGNSGGVDAYVGRHGLKGCDIRLPFPSVGATQNCLIAAMGARGSTRIFNASSEPEIWDLWLLPQNARGADRG